MAADTFQLVIVEDLRNEVPRWRPLARRRHLRAFRELRAQSPDEWRTYRRLERILLSWSCLDVAATAALVQALI